MPARKTTVYVLQYQGQHQDDWTDLSKRDTPEEAFGRLDVFSESWRGAPGTLHVIRRDIAETVIEDPRPAARAS